MNLRYQLFKITRLTFALAIILIVPHFANANDDDCEEVQPNYKENCGARYEEFLSKTLAPGKCFKMEVKSASKWNASGIRLDSKGKYDFEVVKVSSWKDATIPATPEGWKRDSDQVKNFGVFKQLYFAVTKFFRRAPKQEWFVLMGATAGADYKHFKIGKKLPGQNVVDGEFCAFANDLGGAYGNNTGSLELLVKRTK
jgi:hypothetical protein